MVLDLIGDEGLDVLHEPDDELDDAVHDEAGGHQRTSVDCVLLHRVP